VNALLPNPFPSNLPARNAWCKHPKVDNAFILPNVSRLHEFLPEAPNLNQSRHQSWSTISSQSSIWLWTKDIIGSLPRFSGLLILVRRISLTVSCPNYDSKR
jgi:hypothetical protein